MGALLERDGDLARLDRALEAAAAGEGRCLLIEGEAGIGKTALLERAAERAAERGLWALRARGGELERELAFGLARQLFERELLDASEASRAELLAGAARLAAPLLAVSGEPGSAPPDPTAAMHGLYWLVANAAAERPLALMIDDLHWGDLPSLRFLAYLLHRLEGVAATVIGGLRVAEPGTPTDLLGALGAEPVSERLAPQRLSEQAVAHLVRAELGSQAAPELCRACHEVSGGNPFLLGELVAELRTEGVALGAEGAAHVREIGPTGLSQSVLARLGGLGDESVRLARASAVLGSGASLTATATLAELSLERAAELADRLSEARILAPGTTVEFQHPLVRNAIYRDLGARRRATAHARAARILAELGTSTEQVAAHLLEAPPAGDGWVVTQLRTAASEALERTSPEPAVHYLRRALAEPPPEEERAAVLHMLGSAEALGGDLAATSHMSEALELVEDPIQRARIALELALLWATLGEPRRGVELIDGELAAFGEGPAELAVLLKAARVSVAQLGVSTFPLVEPELEREGEGMEGGSFAERALLAALTWRRATAAEPGAAEVLRLGRRAHAGWKLIEEMPPVSALHMQPTLGLIVADHFDAAAEAIAATLRVAGKRATPFLYGACMWLRSHLGYRLGKLEEALDDCERAFELALQRGWRLPILTTLEPLLRTLVEVGELDRAQDALDAIAPAPAELSGDQLAPAIRLRHARALLRLAQGRLEEALEELVAVGGRMDEAGWSSPAIFAWRSEAAQVLLRLGRGEEAERLAAEEVELARSFGAPRALGLALRAQGLAAGGDRGLALLREAVGVLETSPAQLARAQALVDLGAALRRSGERAAARDPLAQGLELADRCGANPLAERAREELRAAGARPRRPVRSGAEALTPSERRVAEMAAEGMSNPEIAQALFVTRRTVEQHLTSAYGKLGIAGRGELAGAIGGSASQG